MVEPIGRRAMRRKRLSETTAQGAPAAGGDTPVVGDSASAAPPPPVKRRGRWTAHGRRPEGEMNGTERAYAVELERRQLAGEIVRWDFQPEKLRLALLCWYEPDFRVLMTDGEIQMHEVKGFIEPAGRVKIKVAAEQHPMYWFFQVTRVAKKHGGGWKLEVI